MYTADPIAHVKGRKRVSHKNCHDYRTKLQLPSLWQTELVSRPPPLFRPLVCYNTVSDHCIIQCLSTQKLDI
jgi:hypothetical protein